MKKLLFLLLIPFSLSAQVKGVVLDSISGKPIAYVNIWVENENIGTTSEENGGFSLDINEEKNIVFSALGYETKILKSTEIKEVYLKAIVYEMEEIVLEIPKKTKELKVGDAKNNNSRHLSGDKPSIFGKLFYYEEKYEETPFLKSILFYTDSEIKGAKLKVRIFEIKDSIPSEDILYEDIIVSVKKGKKKNELDISKYNIKFPKNGLLIGLECMFIEENKYLMNYKEHNSSEKSKHSYFAPSLIINYSETENSFSYYGGKWLKNIKNLSNDDKRWSNKVITPAIDLILTN